jgi:hypothetical protein
MDIQRIQTSTLLSPYPTVTPTYSGTPIFRPVPSFLIQGLKVLLKHQLTTIYKILDGSTGLRISIRNLNFTFKS